MLKLNAGKLKLELLQISWSWWIDIDELIAGIVNQRMVFLFPNQTFFPAGTIVRHSHLSNFQNATSSNEPPLNLSSGSVEWSFPAVINNTPGREVFKQVLSISVKKLFLKDLECLRKWKFFASLIAIFLHLYPPKKKKQRNIVNIKAFLLEEWILKKEYWQGCNSN